MLRTVRRSRHDNIVGVDFPSLDHDIYVDQLLDVLSRSNNRLVGAERELAQSLNAKASGVAYGWQNSTDQFKTQKEREAFIEGNVLEHTLDINTLSSEIRGLQSTLATTMRILEVVTQRARV